MSERVWTDSLAAPRSLATRGETGVAIIEDPGVVELCLSRIDKKTLSRCAKIVGAELPTTPWQTVVAGEIRTAWVGMRRWRIIGDRERMSEISAVLLEKIGGAAVFDLTGAFACFRIVGTTANEILMRVCPLDLRGVEPDHARGTSIAGVHVLLIRESLGNSWLALAPRSYAEHVAAALVEAARTPGRLALFEPAKPPAI
jgi:heterotetrameric sarcosine oxidase gamma subunit